MTSPFGLLRNTIQLSKYEDLIGFVKPFMSWAASHLARRDAPRSCTKWKVFIGKRVGHVMGKIKRLLQARTYPFGGEEKEMAGFFIIQIASLMLVRKFQI